MRASSVEQLQQQASPHVIHFSQTGSQQQQQQTQLMQGTVSGNSVINCRVPQSTASPDQRLIGASHQVTGTLSHNIQQETQTQIQHAGTGTATLTVVKQQNCHSQFLMCNKVTQHYSKVIAIYVKLMKKLLRGWYNM